MAMPSEACAVLLFFFSSRRRHTRLQGDWSSDVCSSDLFFGDTGHLLVTGVEPQTKRQADTEDLKWRDVRRHQRRKGIGVPLGCRDHAQRDYREQDEDFQSCGDRANHLRSEEHTSELQSPCNLVCRLLLEKKKTN